MAASVGEETIGAVKMCRVNFQIVGFPARRGSLFHSNNLLHIGEWRWVFDKLHAVYLKRNYFTRPEKEDQFIYTENETLCQLEPPTTSSYDRDEYHFSYES